MEKFIVSARKYRPQTFSSVVGQQHITTTLKNSIKNNTLAHAFLFCGPRGVGKTTCARILAKTINCESLQPDGEACNTCNSCVSFNNGTSLNIHELDAASNNSVDDIRELVTQIRFAPQAGQYKIYIIDEVHMLSAAAFNAFLKTLEEPPSYAKFILATTEKHKILPTILSRCQIFDFKRITNNDTVIHLQEIAEKEHIEAEKAALQLIAQKSEGCMRDSLSILDKIVSFTDAKLTYQNTLEHLNLLDEDYYFQLIDYLIQQDVAGALLLYDKINRKGFEGSAVLEGFAEFLRNLMVSRDARAAELLDVLEGMQEKYAATAKKLSLSYLVSSLNVVSESSFQYRAVNNKRLHVELCLIKLCYLLQALDLAANATGQVVKKSTIPGPVAVKTTPVQPIFNYKATAQTSAHLNIEGEAKAKAAKPIAQAPAPPLPAKTIQSAVAMEPAPPAMAAAVPVSVTATPATAKLNLLEKMKQQKQAERMGRVVQEARVPQVEEVQTLWANYCEKMKAAERHTTVTNMSLATLSIEGNTIVVLSESVFGGKVLEQLTTDLTVIFREHFFNPQITMRVDIANPGDIQPKELEPKYLNAQQRYRMMVEEYPMVQELKETLKLDL